jgi:cytochrome c-type biogenesis protein
MSGGVGHLVMNGPLILAVPVAAAAGAITFISPCCLPLIPGYLSYVTGMSGAWAAGPAAGAASPRPHGGNGASGPHQVTARTATVPRIPTVAQATPATWAARARGHALAGTAPFVLGFSAVFASYGAAFGGLGEVLLPTGAS